MKLSTLPITQPAAGTGVARAVTPRPYGTYGNGIGMGIAGGIGTGPCTRTSLAAAWSALTTRKSMLVPSFHDRWPLCSTA